MNSINFHIYWRKRKTGSGKCRSPYFYLLICFLCIALTGCQKSSKNAETQAGPIPAPKVTQIDEQALKDVVKPKGRPQLINFWATWCGPCREEFPDLVEIGNEHKDKIDLITVTLDEPSEINTTVPEFLAQMGADFPAFLLKTKDVDAAIEIVSKEWQGALPFTILFDVNGEPIYSKQGKFKPDVLISKIESLP